jgi:ketosteroid isomerase-like protein
MASDNDVTSLQAAFDTWTRALNEGDLDTFWAGFHDQVEVLDEDYPWRMNKAEFVDHIDFHAFGGGKGLWEFFQWVPRETNFIVIGDTGHVSGFSTFRGKPRDAGFRQRFMGFTLTWVREDGTWRVLCWHQSPLIGRILDASPT